MGLLDWFRPRPPSEPEPDPQWIGAAWTRDHDGHLEHWDGRAWRRLPPPLARALSFVSEPRSWAGHEEALGARRELLDQLESESWLRPLTSLSHRPPPEPEPVRFVAVPTTTPEPALAMLARSDLRLPFVVIDDRRGTDGAEDPRIVSRARRMRIAREIAQREGLDGSLVEWIFVGHENEGSTVGGARNFALALGYGRRFATLDDDVCSVSAAAGESACVVTDRTTFDFRPAAPQAWCEPPSYRALLDEAEQVTSTVLAGRARYGRAMRAAGGAGLGAPHLAILSASLHGDWGGESPFGLLTLPDEALRGFDSFEALRTRRWVRRSQSTASVGPAFAWMSYASVFDHRRPLPPLLPNGRGTDDAYAKLLGLSPTTWVGFLRAEACHVPRRERIFPREALSWPVSQASSNALATTVFEDLARLLRVPPLGFDEEGCSAVARALRAMLREGFRPRVVELRSRILLRRVEMLERRRAAGASEVEGLDQAVEECLAVAADGLRDPARVVWPRDLLESGDPEAAWSRLVSRLGRYADALEIWPAILESDVWSTVRGDLGTDDQP